MLERSGLRTTFVRPWYVLGPGHYWPLGLAPMYGLLERIPATREMALRLGLVALEEVVATLVQAVEHPPETRRIIDVQEIAQAGIRSLAV
jgi:uncharacterized protein YbjT (DUF2867 family)